MIRCASPSPLAADHRIMTLARLRLTPDAYNFRSAWLADRRSATTLAQNTRVRLPPKYRSAMIASVTEPAARTPDRVAVICRGALPTRALCAGRLLPTRANLSASLSMAADAVVEYRDAQEAPSRTAMVANGSGTT
jgi:hypothetical protein